MHHPIRRLGYLLLLIGVTACAQGDGENGPGIEVTRRQGERYPITEVRGEPPIGELTPAGVIRGEGEGFGRIRSLALESDGSVWVLDHGTMAIVRYARTGEVVARRGQAGEGPGEYRDPYSLIAIADGLLLYDPGTGRATQYALDGTPAATWTVSRLTGSPASIRWHATDRGPYLNQVFRSDSTASTGFLRLPPTGADDTLLVGLGGRVVSVGDGLPDGLVMCTVQGGGFRIFSSPFGGTTAVAPYRGAAIASATDEYRLYREGAAGDTAAAVIRAVARAPVTDAEWRDGTATHDSVRSTPAGADCRGSLKRPTHKPAVLELVTDADGRLWVERQAVDGVRWEVWTGDTLRGAVQAPPRMREVAPSIRGEWFAVAGEAADGTHEVRVYRVPALE